MNNSTYETKGGPTVSLAVFVVTKIWSEEAEREFTLHVWNNGFKEKHLSSTDFNSKKTNLLSRDWLHD